MKIIYCSLFLVCLAGCHTSNKNNIYKLDLKKYRNVEENIITVNNLLKKIPQAPHYKNMAPVYDIENHYIYITYSNINYNEKDSVLEGRYNPNQQKIDTIAHIDGLSDKEVDQLKQSIYYLESEGIYGNDYLLNDITSRD